MNRPGPKRKPDNTRRVHVLKVPLSSDETALLSRVTTPTATPLSVFVREAAVAAAKRRLP